MGEDTSNKTKEILVFLSNVTFYHMYSCIKSNDEVISYKTEINSIKYYFIPHLNWYEVTQIKMVQSYVLPTEVVQGFSLPLSKKKRRSTRNAFIGFFGKLSDLPF